MGPGGQGWVRGRGNNFYFSSVMLSTVSQQSLFLTAGKCPDIFFFPSSCDCFMEQNCPVPLSCPVWCGLSPVAKQTVFDVGGCDWCGRGSHPCFPLTCPLPAPAWLQGHLGTCSILHQAEGQAGEEGTLLAGLVPVLAALVLSPAVPPVTSLSEGNQYSQLPEGGLDWRSELEL